MPCDMFWIVFPRESMGTFDHVTCADIPDIRLDKQEFFKNPVSKQDVPDYYDIVKKPMCWIMIEAKLDRHEYWDVQAFKACLTTTSCLFNRLTDVPRMTWTLLSTMLCCTTNLILLCTVPHPDWRRVHLPCVRYSIMKECWFPVMVSTTHPWSVIFALK